MIRISKEIEDEINKCCRCGFCRAYCPVFEYKGGESWNTRGRIYLLNALKNGKISISPELLDRIYSCTLCKACDETCPPLVKGAEIVKEVRTSLAKMGVGPLEGHKEMTKNILASGSVLGKRVSLIDVVPSAKNLPDTAPNLLYVGCVVSSGYPNIAETLIQILNKANVNFTVIKDGENCCGKFLDLVGLGEETDRLIQSNWKTFNEMKARNIITVCPFCYSAFLHTVPQGKSVQHSTQTILNLANETKISFNRRLDATVTYFDSCHLGRYEQIYDAPRALIESIPGVKLAEMGKSKQLSRCCGGTIRVPYFDIRAGMSENIVKSAKEVGANYLVTACPTCYHNLRIVAPEYDLKVCAIEDLVGYAMGVVKELPE